MYLQDFDTDNKIPIECNIINKINKLSHLSFRNNKLSELSLFRWTIY